MLTEKLTIDLIELDISIKVDIKKSELIHEYNVYYTDNTFILNATYNNKKEILEFNEGLIIPNEILNAVFEVIDAIENEYES